MTAGRGDCRLSVFFLVDMDTFSREVEGSGAAIGKAVDRGLPWLGALSLEDRALEGRLGRAGRAVGFIVLVNDRS